MFDTSYSSQLIATIISLHLNYFEYKSLALPTGKTSIQVFSTSTIIIISFHCHSQLTVGNNTEEEFVLLLVRETSEFRALGPAGLLCFCPGLGGGVGDVALVVVADVARGTAPMLVSLRDNKATAFS